jgi:hypothetical protein
VAVPRAPYEDRLQQVKDCIPLKAAANFQTGSDCFVTESPAASQTQTGGEDNVPNMHIDTLSGLHSGLHLSLRK